MIKISNFEENLKKVFIIRYKRFLSVVANYYGNKALPFIYQEVSSSSPLDVIIKSLGDVLIEIKKIPPYCNFFDWESDIIVLVDLDDTLFYKKGDPCSKPGDYGYPIKEVVKIIRVLKDNNCKIHIFTARMNSYIAKKDSNRKKEIEQLLLKFDVPYDKIVEILKPSATFFIDDASINPLL